MRRTLMSLCVAGALAWCAVAPGASAQTEGVRAQREQQSQRDELLRILRQRLQVHERLAEQLREQIDAVEGGAELDAIREELRRRPGLRQLAGRAERATPAEGGSPERVRRQLRDRFMEVLREERPELAERIEALREANPEEFDRVRERVLVELMDRAGDPERVRLFFAVRDAETELRALAERIAADPSLASELEPEVRAALDRAADARIAAERDALERRREQLDRREARLDEIVERREAFVEERLERILAGKGAEAPPERPRRPRRERADRDG